MIPFLDPKPFYLRAGGEPEGSNENLPEWMGMSHEERATWVRRAISQAVVAILGRSVGPEEPLMSAGLDSLGKHNIPPTPLVTLKYN